MRVKSDIETLIDALSYNPETGSLIWRIALPRTPAGTDALRVGPKGKAVIRFAGTVFYANRVAWQIAKGVAPEGMIIPKDGNFYNIKLSNLEEVSPAEAARLQKTKQTNTSGVRGVSWNGQTQKWKASITKNYRRYHLGNFNTKEEAALAYARAEKNPAERNAHYSQLPTAPSYERRRRWIGQRALRSMPPLAGFASYEQVLAECGNPPSDKHVLMRPNINQELAPGNAEWRLPYTEGGVKIRYHHAHLGLTTAQFNQLLARQNGKCSICDRPEQRSDHGEERTLCLDHDHKTNLARGVICNECNRALGLFGDDFSRIARAAEYLQTSQYCLSEELNICGVCQKGLTAGKYNIMIHNDHSVLGFVCSDCEWDGGPDYEWMVGPNSPSFRKRKPAA